MQNKHRLFSFSLVGLLSALSLSAAISPVSNAGTVGSKFYESRQDNLLSGSEQTNPYGALLIEPAEKTGLGLYRSGDYLFPTGTGAYYSVNSDMKYFYEELKTITAYGNMTIEGQTVPFSMSFLPGGGQVTVEMNPMNFNYIPYGGGEPCLFAIQINMKGTFVGGDGGAVTGTSESEKYYNACRWDEPPAVEISGPWSGKIYANGTGEGVYNYNISGFDQPSSGQATWQATFPAEEFAAALPPAVPGVGSPQPPLPVDPGEVVPAQPVVPADQTVPTDTGGLFGIPLAVILGSLGIPVAGALAGAALSAILSAFSSVGVSPAALTNAGASLADGVDKLIVEPVDTSLRAGALNGSLVEIDQGLLNRNIYVMNKFQSTPGLVVDGLTKLTNMGWDSAVNAWTGSQASSQGLTCEGYVQNTEGDVKAAVQKYFPGAEVVRWDFYEKSSRNPKGLLDKLDAKNEDNHTLHKVRLIDGTELSIDFHGHNASNLLSNPPILRPFEETRAEWMKRLGTDFMEEEHKNI